MGSISVEACLTWCVEVNVEELGAHLEAYTNLQPTISALRLCHRFGKGVNVFVTKLPIELLTQIEEILYAEERDKLSPDWIAAVTCWESLCEPIDHFSAKECVDLYVSFLEEIHALGECDCECEMCSEVKDCEHCESVLSPPGRLSDQKLQWVIELMDNVENPGHQQACDAHEAQKICWQEKAGRLADGSRGAFSEFETLIHAHFGLKIWVAHTQQSIQSDDHFAAYREGEGSICYSTKAYLTLPDAPKATGNSNRNFDMGGEIGFSSGPSRAAHAMSTPMPSPLTPKLLARFKRAMQVLGVKPKPMSKSHSTLSDADTTDEDHDSVDGEGSSANLESRSEHHDTDEILPELKILVATIDTPDS